VMAVLGRPARLAAEAEAQADEEQRTAGAAAPARSTDSPRSD
jgi:hypothetical protein